METSLKSLFLIGSIVLTGLSAGLFYAWSVSVIPGTQKLMDSTYLETMQSINRAILNPGFFLIFFGSLVTLSIGTIYQFHTSKNSFGLLLASAICYLVGTVGVTALGNVPLNNQLDILNLNDLSTSRIESFRKYYETNWNRLHLIRTAFAISAFVLVVLAVFSNSKIK